MLNVNFVLPVIADGILIEDLSFKNSGILQFQIVQRAADSVVAYLTAREVSHGELEQDVLTSLRRVLPDDVQIKICIVENIDREPNGKYRVVKSEVRP